MREIAEIVRRHIGVYYEVEALDVELRANMDGAQRRATPPWSMMGRGILEEEELTVWRELEAGRLDPDAAIAIFKALMQRYYEGLDAQP